MFRVRFALASAGCGAAMAEQRPGPGSIPLSRRLARSEARWGFFCVSPWIVGFLALTAGPMLASLFFSFTDYDVLSPPRWVGTTR